MIMYFILPLTLNGFRDSIIANEKYYHQLTDRGGRMKKTLAMMQPGETGIITRVNGTGPIKRRIVDMGLVAGTAVGVLKLAPLGDPMEIKVKNFNLSLRKAEASSIDVNSTGGKA